jgi:D-3-phosphoglycerate dehydrogenase / 2-oxoglutarate reductase
MSTRKIVVTFGSGIVEQALVMMKAVAQVAVTRDDSEAALLAEARDADAILVGPMPSVTRNLIESAGRLRHIARVGVGVDSVDIEAATERGILVTNAPEVTADSVAEFTVSLLLSLAKNIPRCDRAVKEGRWDERVELMGTNIELKGKTHGIVGLGKIGRRVAIMCKGFGMRILYFKRNRDLEFEQSAGVGYAPFQALIKECDSVSLHLPLTKETANLFDRPQFKSMKKTALLINQARGKVVNEEALVQALKEGALGGYASDVYESEPPDPKCELFRFKNVVVSPHLAGGTREARQRVSMAVAGDVLKVLQGHEPENLVNRAVLQGKP